MRINWVCAAGAAVALALSACSSSKTEYFKTDGLIAPEGRCEQDPSQLGDVTPLGRIAEASGCYVPNPLSVRSLAGVSFSQPATVNCGMASPVHDWLQNSVQPAAQSAYGERVVSIDVIDSYSCRPRNNQRGAKMSEHGFGNAIDIGAFTLESGRKVSVLEDYYGGRADERFLRQVRGEACGQFHTVLGPGSDAHHRNHFHLDLEQRHSGHTYCK
jgi:hypothetical protein